MHPGAVSPVFLPRMSRLNNITGLTLAVGVAIFLAFVPSLAFPFYGDDFSVIQSLFMLQQEGQLWTQVVSDFGSTWFNGGGNFYRPLVVLSYAIDLTLWGSDPWGWHLTNILLHSLNSVMVFLIVERLLRGLNARGTTLIALAAALFFGLRPIIGEVVFWISGRGDSMALLGMLIAFYAYGRAAGGGRGWLLLSVLTFALALGTKEPAATFPAALVAWHLAHYLASPVREPWSVWLLQTSKSLFPFVLLVGLYLIWRRVLFGSFFQVYPPELVPPMELTNWIWWLGKISTFQYFVGPQLSTSLWVKAQNYLVAALVVGGFLLGFRFRVTRLLWWCGAWWFIALLLVSIQQLYTSPFGEGERLLYIFLFPFTLMIISPLAAAGTAGQPYRNVARGAAWGGAGALGLVLIMSTPWTWTHMEKWEAVGTQITMTLTEIPRQASEVPANQTRILVVPATLDGVFFARNAQGAMMSPPFQTRNWYGPVLVYAAERPCQVIGQPISTTVSDHLCWDPQEQQFKPFDISTYDAGNYPFFWLLDPQSVIQ